MQDEEKRKRKKNVDNPILQLVSPVSQKALGDIAWGYEYDIIDPQTNNSKHQDKGDDIAHVARILKIRGASSHESLSLDNISYLIEAVDAEEDEKDHLKA